LVSNPSILLFDNLDIGIGLIDSNPEREQLCFDNFFVRQGLGSVKYDENEVAGSSGGDDLASTAFAFGGSFDNSGEI
jgi:hypothetical protein